MDNIESRLNAIQDRMKKMSYDDPEYDTLVTERNRLYIKMKLIEYPVSQQKESIKVAHIII